ncbi:hypothetical protein BC628DRAFT_628651 [Trametes gibbosa]|nr:hypothetical protein BC628DRAFT_628651 [Trametes gibbosa]
MLYTHIYLYPVRSLVGQEQLFFRKRAIAGPLPLPPRLRRRPKKHTADVETKTSTHARDRVDASGPQTSRYPTTIMIPHTAQGEGASKNVEAAPALPECHPPPCHPPPAHLPSTTSAVAPHCSAAERRPNLAGTPHNPPGSNSATPLPTEGGASGEWSHGGRGAHRATPPPPAAAAAAVLDESLPAAQSHPRKGRQRVAG